MRRYEGVVPAATAVLFMVVLELVLVVATVGAEAAAGGVATNGGNGVGVGVAPVVIVVRLEASELERIESGTLVEAGVALLAAATAVVATATGVVAAVGATAGKESIQYTFGGLRDDSRLGDELASVLGAGVREITPNLLLVCWYAPSV